MISRLSRSGYVTFLPPAHFKQSFHEFCYWRLCGVCVDRFRDVSVWTIDIGHWELFMSIAVYQLCLEGRFVRIFIRDGATFLRCYPWDGLTVTASSSVGLPEGKSSDCWRRWKLLVHACYILRTRIVFVWRLTDLSRTAVCRIVWRSRPTLVDRLSRRLEVSINRLRACVTEHFFGETNKYVIFGRTWCYWTFLSDFIWAWVRVVGFMGFYILRDIIGGPSSLVSGRRVSHCCMMTRRG
uniref:Uncharacterized protein n=1 Tax=Brassica oleracea TaxID=3712 RepID=A0A3P6H7N7_BRAOL|nr:unnamed protein product [Brassica oleracea]